MKIIGKGKKKKLILEVDMSDIKIITDNDKDEYELDDEINISNRLSILPQLERNKEKFITMLEDLINIILEA